MCMRYIIFNQHVKRVLVLVVTPLVPGKASARLNQQVVNRYSILVVPLPVANRANELEIGLPLLVLYSLLSCEHLFHHESKLQWFEQKHGLHGVWVSNSSEIKVEEEPWSEVNRRVVDGFDGPELQGLLRLSFSVGIPFLLCDHSLPLKCRISTVGDGINYIIVVFVQESYLWKSCLSIFLNQLDLYPEMSVLDDTVKLEFVEHIHFLSGVQGIYLEWCKVLE